MIDSLLRVDASKEEKKKRRVLQSLLPKLKQIKPNERR